MIATDDEGCHAGIQNSSCSRFNVRQHPLNVVHIRAKFDIAVIHDVADLANIEGIGPVRRNRIGDANIGFTKRTWGEFGPSPLGSPATPRDTVDGDIDIGQILGMRRSEKGEGAAPQVFRFARLHHNAFAQEYLLRR